MTNNTEPVTQEDRDAMRPFRDFIESKWTKQCDDAKRIPDVINDELPKILSQHRTAAVAKREAEIVELILEYANIANERYVYDDLRKLCAMIQGKPLPKSTAEIVQEQIGRAMDRPDKFPSIE